MAYGTSNRKTNKKEDNLDRHLKIDDPLDSHLKPVKIGDDITGLQLADKDVKVENDLIVGGDVNVIGDIVAGDPSSSSTISGSSVKLNAASGIVLEAGNGTIDIYNDGLFFGQFNTTSAGILGLLSSTDYDIYLKTLGTGDIVLDSGGGKFISKVNGTEFSAADSAYAGMILGYTRLQGDLTNANSYEIQDSMTVEDSTHRITFKTPPSEKVEIEATCLIDVLSTDTEVNIGLSDSNTYNKLGEQFEYDTTGVIFSDDEADDHIVVSKFVLEAAQLASIGSSNTFYIGFSTSGATKVAYLKYGLRASHDLADHPFVIKATALPATIYDGQ